MSYLPGIERLIKAQSEVTDGCILARQKQIQKIIDEDKKKRVVIKPTTAPRSKINERS